MNSETENDKNQIGFNKYGKYQVHSQGCRYKIGDLVKPDMIIGLHYKTGQPVKANLNGRIATIYYNPMHDSYVIMAVSDNSPAEMVACAIN